MGNEAMSEIDLIAQTAWRDFAAMGAFNTQDFTYYVRRALLEYGQIVREECAKVLRDKAQELANDHMHTEYDTGAGVWDSPEAEWQAILLNECADEMTNANKG